MIVVVGSVNLDLVASVAELPGPGETIHASDFTTVHGGKGANQAVAAARLGGDVSLVAAVGGDRESESLQDALTAEGVDTDHVLSKLDSVSGVALITVDSHGENTISVYAGANAELSLTPQARSLVERADIVLMQLEIPMKTVVDAAAAARGIVILNAAPATKLPHSLVDAIDMLIVNESEWQTVSGAGAVDAVQTVITTLGGRGASIATPDGIELIPAPKVDVVDTTGAGDTFCGAFAEALDRGKDVRGAVRWATLAGSLATTSIGARTAMPSRTEMQLRTRKPS